MQREEVQLDQTLRDILVCPRCKGPLMDVERGLLCVQDHLVFPIQDGVPFMLDALAKKAQPERYLDEKV